MTATDNESCAKNTWKSQVLAPLRPVHRGRDGSQRPPDRCRAELLEALQLVVDKLGSDFELYREQQFAIDTARAAIAKATGSTHV
jgi:hypothetical protein